MKSATTIDTITFNLKRITRLQMKSILEFAGYRRLPIKKDLVVQMFLQGLEERPNEMCLGYDAIVLKKLPEGDGEAVPPDVDEFINRVKTEIEEKSALSITQIHDFTAGLIDDIKIVMSNGAKQAIKEAAENATPKIIEVRQEGKKPKRVKGTLPKEFEDILKLAMARQNVLMVGPAGCGKTFLGEKVAEALSLEFSSVSCTSGMGESELKGWLLPTGASGRFEYVQSQFIDRYENGGVFLLDEIDASDPNVLVFINQALANGEFFLAQRFKNPKVVRHKDFICLAAANTYGHGADMMYVGRNQLDAATLDRFRVGVIKMDYDPDVENALVHPEVLLWGRAIREKIRQHSLRRIMSMRVMINITEMIRVHGIENWPKEEWERSFFSDWTVDEIRRVGGTVQ